MSILEAIMLLCFGAAWPFNCALHQGQIHQREERVFPDHFAVRVCGRHRQ